MKNREKNITILKKIVQNDKLYTVGNWGMILMSYMMCLQEDFFNEKII